MSGNKKPPAEMVGGLFLFQIELICRRNEQIDTVHLSKLSKQKGANALTLVPFCKIRVFSLHTVALCGTLTTGN